MTSTCFLVFFHNLLPSNIRSMGKKRIYPNKLPYRRFFKVINAKHGFYNGGKVKNFEISFLARKIYQYWIRIYQNMRNSNIWVGMFSNKSTFVRKHTPPNVAIPHLLVYSNSVLVNFSSQKWDFKIIYFPPIIKSMFCPYNFEKSSIWQFI